MWPNYSPSCRKSVDELLRKGGSLSAYKANKDYGAGPTEGSYAWRLEREIEKRFKVKHAVAVNSGTAALHAALGSLDLRGGEVITSPYTFSATASAILLAGGTPVFADVDPHTFCISKETVKRVVSRRTKAILPVHLFGGIAGGDRYTDLAELGLPIVEDACQAVGARLEDRFAGNLFSVAGAYSFNGGKNVPAGECGALVTNDARVAEKARLLGNHAENFGTSYVGFNYRPNEVTAAIAYHGLLELEERNKRRQELAGVMREVRAYHPDLERPWPEPESSHVWYVYPFLVKRGRRAELIEGMAKRGVHVGAGYIQPTLNRYSAFRKYQRTPLPVVEELSKKTLALLYDLTPDKEISFAEGVAGKMLDVLND